MFYHIWSLWLNLFYIFISMRIDFICQPILWKCIMKSNESFLCAQCKYERKVWKWIRKFLTTLYNIIQLWIDVKINYFGFKQAFLFKEWGLYLLHTFVLLFLVNFSVSHYLLKGFLVFCFSLFSGKHIDSMQFVVYICQVPWYQKSETHYFEST